MKLNFTLRCTLIALFSLVSIKLIYCDKENDEQQAVSVSEKSPLELTENAESSTTTQKPTETREQNSTEIEVTTTEAPKAESELDSSDSDTNEQAEKSDKKSKDEKVKDSDLPEGSSRQLLFNLRGSTLHAALYENRRLKEEHARKLLNEITGDIGVTITTDKPRKNPRGKGEWSQHSDSRPILNEDTLGLNAQRFYRDAWELIGR